jgi:hypothetical protein
LEEKKIELDLMQMLKCYEKTYGRYFIDSEKKWKEIDKLRKEQKEENREEQSMIIKIVF